MDTNSASAREALGRNSGFLREWVHSAPEVNSRPALLLEWPRSSSTTAVACFSTRFAGFDVPRAVFRTIAFTQNGEGYTVDASADFFFVENSGHRFYEHLVSADFPSCPKFARVEFFGALDDEEFFIVEGSGVAGSPGV